MMTLPWSQIVAHYEEYEGPRQSIRASGRLARLINEGPLGGGLLPGPPCLTYASYLCIVQCEVSYLIRTDAAS
jgi:hypothetical protein